MTEIPPSTTTQLDVLLAIARLEGKLDGALMQQNRHEATLQEHRVEITQLRDKVVALETQRKNAPSWTAVVSAIVAGVMLLLVVAQQLYGAQ
ncbi:MAG TPA: hypothetical protein VIQ79_09505 [Kribbella sp.]